MALKLLKTIILKAYVLASIIKGKEIIKEATVLHSGTASGLFLLKCKRKGE